MLVIFFFALIFLRAGGKKARKQMTPSEMLLLVALGSAVGDAMIYPTTAVIYAALIILTIIVLQFFVARMKLRLPFVEKFINSRPNLLVHNGAVVEKALLAENITQTELESTLRSAGVRNIGAVEYAYLELDGNVSVFTYPKGQEKDGKEITPVPDVEKFMRV
ncbi:DUF421 domain-containing protein [Candidatus Pacebacteria bacterium]|nr:DUF421 domain-containing protein [Candidatus Paceibacterota bacterium]